MAAGTARLIAFGLICPESPGEGVGRRTVRREFHPDALGAGSHGEPFDRQRNLPWNMRRRGTDLRGKGPDRPTIWPLPPRGVGATLTGARELGTGRTKGAPMRNQPATCLVSAAVLAVVLAGLPACTQGQREAVLELGSGAVSKVSRSVGHDAGEIKAGTNQVGEFASQYGASADEVAAVAKSADSYEGWIRPQVSIDEMAAAARAAKGNKFVSAGVSVACDWMAGKVTNKVEFQKAVGSAMQGMLMTQQQAFREATTDLAGKLAFIKAKGTEKDKAAAVWICYAYSATS